MLIVGLTGGIGSGKSTVAELFSKLNVPIIDADVIAREVITTDTTNLEKIIAHFGSGILDTKSQLDRAKLRKCIFEDTTQRQWLENLLHPTIIAEIKQRISKLNTPYCIVVIPLLTEVLEAQQLVDRILMIDVPEELQIKRTTQRDRLKAQEIALVLASQASRAQRLHIADDVLCNTGDMVALKQAVLRLHQSYMSTEL